MKQVQVEETDEEDNAYEFLQDGSVYVVAPSESSRDPIWLMKIERHLTASTDITDSAGVLVLKGQDYMEARWLEQHGETKAHVKFEIKDEIVFLFKESVVYPFVNHSPGKKVGEVFVNKRDYYILVYADEYGISSI